MIGWTGVFVWALILVGGANVVAYFGAAIAAEIAKAAGRVSPDKPRFLPFFHDPFAARFIEHVYTDRHRDYGSAFITWCVRILRVTTPLTLILWIALMVSLFI